MTISARTLDQDCNLFLRTLNDHLEGVPTIQLTDGIMIARQADIPGDTGRGTATERLQAILRILEKRGHVKCPAGRAEMVTLTDEGALHVERQSTRTST